MSGLRDGAASRLRGWLPTILFVVIVLLVFLALTGFNPHDDTDPPDGRSGMMLLTDHGTGCQYLYRGGAITPRMDASGKQVCGAR